MLADVYRSLTERDIGDERVGNTMRSAYEQLPAGEKMAEWMRHVGGPVSFKELDVDAPLLEEAMAHAHNLRDRYTGLKIMNQYGLLPDIRQYVKHGRG